MRLPYSAAAAAALISCAAARAGAGSCACRLLCAASQIPVLPHFQKWDLFKKREYVKNLRVPRPQLKTSKTHLQKIIVFHALGGE